MADAFNNSVRPVTPSTDDSIDVGNEAVHIEVNKVNLSKDRREEKRHRTFLIFDPRSKNIRWKKRWGLGFRYTTIPFLNIGIFWIYNDAYLIDAVKSTSGKYSITGNTRADVYNIFKFVIVDPSNKVDFDKKVTHYLKEKVKKIDNNLVKLPQWTKSSVAHPRVLFQQSTGSVVGGKRITRKRRRSRRRKSILSKKNKYSRKNKISKRTKRSKRNRRRRK